VLSFGGSNPSSSAKEFIMSWICTREIQNENGVVLFIKDKVYEEYDDRGEADDIAICLLSEQIRKVYLADEWVRDNFEEIEN